MQFISKNLYKKHVSFYVNTYSLSEHDEKTNHAKISKPWNFEPKGHNGKHSFFFLTVWLIVYIP
jgi:hypothetical protein